MILLFYEKFFQHFVFMKIILRIREVTMFKSLQKIGKSFMLPIAILPAAGLLLGIGGALSNPNTVNAYPALNQSFLQGIFKIMASSGETVFVHLALIMCIGLTVGLAKTDKGRGDKGI